MQISGTTREKMKFAPWSGFDIVLRNEARLLRKGETEWI